MKKWFVTGMLLLVAMLSASLCYGDTQSDAFDMLEDAADQIYLCINDEDLEDLEDDMLDMAARRQNVAEAFDACDLLNWDPEGQNLTAAYDAEDTAEGHAYYASEYFDDFTTQLSDAQLYWVSGNTAYQEARYQDALDDATSAYDLACDAYESGQDCHIRYTSAAYYFGSAYNSINNEFLAQFSEGFTDSGAHTAMHCKITAEYALEDAADVYADTMSLHNGIQSQILTLYGILNDIEDIPSPTGVAASEYAIYYELLIEPTEDSYTGVFDDIIAAVHPNTGAAYDYYDDLITACSAGTVDYDSVPSLATSVETEVDTAEALFTNSFEGYAEALADLYDDAIEDWQEVYDTFYAVMLSCMAMKTQCEDKISLINTTALSFTTKYTAAQTSESDASYWKLQCQGIVTSTALTHYQINVAAAPMADGDTNLGLAEDENDNKIDATTAYTSHMSAAYGFIDDCEYQDAEEEFDDAWAYTGDYNDINDAYNAIVAACGYADDAKTEYDAAATALEALYNQYAP